VKQERRERNEGSLVYISLYLLAYALVQAVEVTCPLVNDDINELISYAEWRMLNERSRGEPRAGRTDRWATNQSNRRKRLMRSSLGRE
jgi:hypothetical protein